MSSTTSVLLTIVVPGGLFASWWTIRKYRKSAMTENILFKKLFGYSIPDKTRNNLVG